MVRVLPVSVRTKIWMRSESLDRVVVVGDGRVEGGLARERNMAGEREQPCRGPGRERVAAGLKVSG